MREGGGGEALTFVPQVRYYDPLPWDTLKREFSVPAKMMQGYPVLFLDQPLWTVNGLDFPATKRLLVAFFRKLKRMGLDIHLKPHPQFHDNTSLEDHEELFSLAPFPNWMPSQLICDQYRAVLFFFSTSVEAADKNTRFTLFPIIKFKDDESGRLSHQYTKDILSCFGGVAGEISPDDMDHWASVIAKAVKHSEYDT
ncbi:MAG: hypothetical protein HQ501_12000 [Rhodospirillales bacterium]|nr:hypothetical protein [Rhodospirillales bacterium]